MAVENSFRWGFSTLGCPDWNLEQVLSFAAENKLSAVELRFLDGTDDLNAALAAFLRRTDAPAVRHDSGVRVSALLTSFRMCVEDESAFSQLCETALLADALDAPYIRVFDGREWGEDFSEDDIRTCRAFLDKWREWRRASGIRCEIALETHGATASTARTTELFARTGTCLPVIWDTHHTYRLTGDAFAETWRQLGDCVVEVHVKDSIPICSDHLPYTYVLPGTGDFPVHDVLSLLQGSHFSGNVILEWERKWHPSLPPLDQAVEAMKKSGWIK